MPDQQGSGLTLAPSAVIAGSAWVSTVFRCTLVAVFLVAGGLKVDDPQSSVQAVRAYRLLPGAIEPLVGWGLPFVEISLGLILATGLFTRTAAAVAAALLLLFIAEVSSAAARGLSIDWGCFGGGGAVAVGETRYGAEILRDTGLLAMTAWLIWRPRSRLSLDRTYRGPTDAGRIGPGQTDDKDSR